KPSKTAASKKGSSTWAGPAYPGRLDPVDFFKNHTADVNPGSLAKLDACLHVVLTIAPNEGKLDACRAADGALLSTGMQQWSPHVNTEITPLLHRDRKSTRLNSSHDQISY